MSRKAEASTLIVMLGSAFFVAAIVVVGLVLYFGSSNTYRLHNILISPLELKDGKIEFVHADTNKKEWRRYLISNKAYATFYNTLLAEVSIPGISDEVIEQFYKEQPSTLTLTKSGIFQQIEFLPDNLFRVLLRGTVEGGSLEEQWVYFRKPNIYYDVVEQFIQ